MVSRVLDSSVAQVISWIICVRTKNISGSRAPRLSRVTTVCHHILYDANRFNGMLVGGANFPMEHREMDKLHLGDPCANFV